MFFFAHQKKTSPLKKFIPQLDWRGALGQFAWIWPWRPQFSLLQSVWSFVPVSTLFISHFLRTYMGFWNWLVFSKAGIHSLPTMFFWKYSPKLKYLAVRAAINGKKLEKINASLAASISPDLLFRWLKLYNRTREVVCDPSTYFTRGQPFNLDENDVEFITELVTEKPTLYASKIQNTLNECGGIQATLKHCAMLQKAVKMWILPVSECGKYASELSWVSNFRKIHCLFIGKGFYENTTV